MRFAVSSVYSRASGCLACSFTKISVNLRKLGMFDHHVPATATAEGVAESVRHEILASHATRSHEAAYTENRTACTPSSACDGGGDGAAILSDDPTLRFRLARGGAPQS